MRLRVQRPQSQESDYSAPLTYLLTPWCRILLEQLTGLQLVNKFPAFHGTRRVITALPSLRHLSLSWASLIQSIYPHPTSCRSVLILSTHRRLSLSSGLFTSGFPTKTLYTPLSSPIRATCPAQPISLFSILSPAQNWVSSTNHLAPPYAISSIPPLPRPSSVQIFSSTPCSLTPSASFPPAMSTTKFHTHTKQQGKLCFYISSSLNFSIATWKTKYSAPNDSKHFLTSICS